MTETRLGDLFYACYYARDPVMLSELSAKADALEIALKDLQKEHEELQWRMSELEK